MKLHIKQQGTGQPILLLHGVLGSLSNLNQLANNLSTQYQTIQVDLRNHGLSPWSEIMDYPSMASDIIELCHNLALTNVIIIGHSMGGKLAMRLTQIAPSLIEQIIVLDIAPVKYQQDNNRDVFDLLSHCIQQKIVNKKNIAELMRQAGIAEPTILFLLKSFKEEKWLFNFNAIHANYKQICDWQPISAWLKPTLFIRGGKSDYVIDEYHNEMRQQFPYMQIETIPQSGHNVHAEKPAQVLSILQDWLAH